MSEFDSLSDSDWQEVASGRDSDDNDSLSELDSDREEINSMPLSRRSSISYADSLSSDVDCWQGLVSDNGDDDMYPAPLASPLGAEPVAVGLTPNLNEVVNPTGVAEEDQRVKDALDQSFVGTLSASRSSNAASAHSPSVHNSIRDLRLSFPDPLTSSHDELNRSYDSIPSPTETTVSSSTDDDVNNSEAVPPIIGAPLAEDLGIPSPTPGVQLQEVQQLESAQKPELQIVLYGSSSAIKWDFIQELIQKAAGTPGTIYREDEKTQSVHFIRESEEYSPFFNNISIDDRTIESDRLSDVDDPADSSGYPSLAIVYLPTAKLPVLPLHNAYLPVLIPSVNDVGDISLQSAEDDWELLGVPESRTLKLGAGDSLVFDAQELSYINPNHAYEILCGIDRNIKRITGTRPLTEQLKSINAVTLFALMSIIMGFAFNTLFRPIPPSPTPTTSTPSSSNGHFWGIFAPQPNRSLLAPFSVNGAKGSNNDVVVNPSLKDMAISVFNPGSTSLSMTSCSSSAISLSVASSSKGTPGSTIKCQHCGSGSKSGAADMVLRSTTTTSIAAVPHVTPSGSITADKESETTAEQIPKSTTASGFNFNSVSDMFDATTKALAEAMGNDLAELVEAADDLMLSIRAQTDRQWKGKARALGEQLQNFNGVVMSKHERAKLNARAFGKKAGEIMREATEPLRMGTGRAQKKAREQMLGIIEGGAEAWKAYERAQEEWEDKLSGKERKHGQERMHGKSERRRDKQGKENDRYHGRACLRGTRSRRLLRDRHVMEGDRICDDI